MVQAYEKHRRPPSRALLLGLAISSVLLFFLYVSYLRGKPRNARWLRTQLVLVALLLLLAAGAKLLLMLSAWSGLWIPLVALVIPVSLHIDRRTAAATAIAGAAAISLLNPIDFPLLVVLAAQSIAASVAVRPHGPLRLAISGSLAAALAGFGTVAAVSLLQQQHVDLNILSGGHASGPIDALLRSDVAASFCAPLIAGLGALLLSPLMQHLLRQVRRGTLSSLADFEHPLLKRLASRATGTWAHSVNMANMAEMAANAIQANGLLARVGAYYHDVGKTEYPNYFIENQAGKNPHDELEPEVSADAIISHVPSGVKLARKHGLPEAVIEFIYTHHANERLEYFWHKQAKQSQKRAPIDDSEFRYQGPAPHSRETGILSLCDAVEAASRTLIGPDEEQISALVHRIVLKKVLSGVLDDSGLTIEDLRKITLSMTETLRSASHGRVKYPWQQAGGESAHPKSAPLIVVEERGEAEPELLDRSTRPIGSRQAQVVNPADSDDEWERTPTRRSKSTK